jgi:hypothetical protein
MKVRYTIYDVQMDETLRPLALDYLKNWRGEWYYLANAQRAVARGENLANSVIKGILNCMLSDARVINMPEPTHKAYDASARSTALTGDRQIVKRTRVREPSWRVQVRWRMRLPYVTSANIGAKKIHVVERSSVGWWYRTRHPEWPDTRMLPSIDMRARLVCSAGFFPTAVMLTEEQALELIVGGEREVCGKCRALSEHKLPRTLTAYDSGKFLEEYALADE